MAWYMCSNVGEGGLGVGFKVHNKCYKVFTAFLLAKLIISPSFFWRHVGLKDCLLCIFLEPKHFYLFPLLPPPHPHPGPLTMPKCQMQHTLVILWPHKRLCLVKALIFPLNRSAGFTICYESFIAMRFWWWTLVNSGERLPTAVVTLWHKFSFPNLVACSFPPVQGECIERMVVGFFFEDKLRSLKIHMCKEMYWQTHMWNFNWLKSDIDPSILGDSGELLLVQNRSFS